MHASRLQWASSPAFGAGLETSSSSCSKPAFANFPGGGSVNSLKTRGLFLIKANDMEASRTVNLNGHAGNSGT